MRPIETDPAFEELLRDAAPRAATPLSGRERISEAACAVTMLAVVAVAIAAAPGQEVPGWTAVVLVAVYAVMSRVSFSAGVGATSPAQLAFVPMLVLLPPAWVPLFVACALAVARLPEHLTGRAHPDRLLLHAGDAWYAVGPALVLLAFGVEDPGLEDWPVFALAMAAQIVLDVVISTVRAWMATGAPPDLQVRILAVVSGVDIALAPVGFMTALVAVEHPVALLLTLPLAGVLAALAHEREMRLEHALALSDAYRGTALLMGEMLEADDPYTGGEHTKGVVALCIAVGHHLELDPHEQRILEFGALLHDIGKLKVPDEIINKPGKLTDEEWEIIKRHPEDGQRMLDQIGGSLAEVGLTVRSHHERWDGRGYPDGLVGDAIPLNARIICACDAFSAMTTTRSYREAMPSELAFAELRECSGTQFDPRVVEAVIAVVEAAEPVQPSVALVA